MQNSWIWRLCTQQLAGRCCVGWSFHSFLADGVLVHGPGGRPWARQGGIDLPRWCLQLRNFQYWAVRDWVDRKLAEACYTFSIQVILERLYKYKASTYFPISPPHCNRIIALAAWLTPFHWGGQGLWNFGTGAMLWGRRSSDGRCKEDLETIWTKLGCGSIFCQVFVEPWCSKEFVWILPFKKQRALALPVVVWIIVSKISWLFRMFHWNSISQQSHPKLIHVGLLSLWSSCSISSMSRRTRCF